MNASPGTEPGQPDDDDAGVADDTPTTATPPARTESGRLLPTQSREDTDAGWGEYRDRDEDDRLLRDRPPHWDNA